MININRNTTNKSTKNMQRLLDIIYNNPKYYPGSFHENTNIPEIVDAIYKILYQENNETVHFIIDRNKNNSMDLTIDKID
jgi:hypothetical protein